MRLRLRANAAPREAQIRWEGMTLIQKLVSRSDSHKAMNTSDDNMHIHLLMNISIVQEGAGL
jgi:hypothetical protein